MLGEGTILTEFSKIANLAMFDRPICAMFDGEGRMGEEIFNGREKRVPCLSCCHCLAQTLLNPVDSNELQLTTYVSCFGSHHQLKVRTFLH